MDAWPLVGREAESQVVARELAAHGALVVEGEAGCGKSRLLREHLRGVTGPVAVVAATDAARSVALGAFAAVLPDELPGDPFDRLQAAVTWLTSNVVLVAIDDAHLLDPVSATLVEHLVATEEVAVLATVRRGASPTAGTPPTFAPGGVPHLRLAALDRPAVAALVTQVLGGPVTARTEHLLWRRSRGNPLALREVLAIAQEVGALRDHQGTWALDPDVDLPVGLEQVIGARVAALDAEEREVLELVALGDPLPLTVARELDLVETCERLEVASLVRLDAHRESVWIRPHHPLHAEAIRAALPTLRRVRHAAVLATAAPALAALDPVRAATWQVDAGEPGDPQLLRRAAAVARSTDGRRGLQLARAAADLDPSTASFCGVAQAAAAVGDAEGTSAALDRAEAAARTEDDLVEVAVTATRWAGWEPTLEPRTADRTSRIRAQVTGRAGLERIDTEVGMLAAVAGDLARADAAVQRVLDRPDVSAPARLTALSIGASLEVLSGRTDAVEDQLDAAEALAEELDDRFHQLHLAASRLHWLALTGRIDAAVERGRWDLAAAEDRRGGDAVRVHAAWSAMVLEWAGALDAAAAAVIDAEPGNGHADPMVLRALLPTIRAVIDAQRGDAGSAARQLARVPPDADRDIRVRAWGARAEVWSLASRGEFDAAAALALRVGDELQERSWHLWAARLYHDAVRIGRPRRAEEALAALCEQVHDSAVTVQLMVEHARAEATSDPAALDAVADRWLAAGGALVAAEASGRASIRYAAEGRAARAARAAARAETWVQRCPGAATPALAGWRSTLTDREREVAWAAAAGHTSRDIADRLVLSVRTVDNHLASTYRKLGISGREELAAALGVAASPAPGGAPGARARQGRVGPPTAAPPSS